MTQLAEVEWPTYFHPSRCPIHIRNTLDMSVSPELVWAWLIRAPLWPAWYSNSANVRILHDQGADLQMNSRFRWKTMGVTLTCTVDEYIPMERIAWSGSVLGLNVCHAWVIVPTDKGCWVLTEETQRGITAAIGKLFVPRRLKYFHQIWLEGLAVKSREGLPPAV